MKLCPQCDFIYEDDQRFCDMDGKELVYDPAPVFIEANVANPLSPTPKRLAGRRSRSFAVAVVVGLVLAGMVIAGYLAHQARLRAASESSAQSADRSIARSTAEIPAQPTSEDTGEQTSASDIASTQTPLANTALAEQSAEPSFEQLPEQSPSQTDAASGSASLSQSPPSRASLSPARLAANPVSARGPSGNSRGPVIVRLTNGAAIEADEVWERKEGVWYRQAGMVIFLKRSRVRTIERLAPAPARSKPAANNAEQKSRKTENATAQNQLRLARLEAADTKKQSRLTSFLKRTGRILRKPFKL
ncbi:MAG: hypothetical protein ACREA9_26805 [Pyrinomonadaceae bacterium]